MRRNRKTFTTHLQYDFRLVSLLAGGTTLFTLLLLIIIPESPVFYVMHNKLDKAKRSFSTLWHISCDDAEIDSKINDVQSSRAKLTESGKKISKWREFLNPQLYKPLSIMFLFFVFQQLCGIFVVFIYAAQFSKEAGVVIDAFLSAVIIGVIRLVTTVFISFISDKYGRKPLAVCSGIGMFFCMSGMAACVSFKFKLIDTPFEWIPALFLFVYIFSGTLGFLTLPFAMVGELFPPNMRGTAVGLSITFCYLLNFLVVKTFPTVFEMFGSQVMFIFYGAVSLLGILFAIFILPETKGRTLKEIERYFQ